MVELGNDKLAPESRLDSARAELIRRIRAGQHALAEDLRDDYADIWPDPEMALELIYTEYVTRRECGQTPSRDELLHRFPEYQARLRRLFGLYDLMNGADTQPNRIQETVHDHDEAHHTDELREHPAGYTLMEEIGRGGSAIVYRALQHSLNRLVAIKVLRSGPWFGADDAPLLRKEAELAAKLQHPNIVQVFEVGQWNGMPYLSMELVAGAGLHNKLTDLKRQGSWLSTTQAAELVEAIARAIQFAHERGIVHRDLKPANVLLQNDGCNNTLKIADFGLACSLDSTQTLHQTSTVTGTPCYMAPEQADGRKADIGPKTDVYALGAILYELLTARPPFQGATIVETLDRVRTDEPVAPRVIQPHNPKDLETICLKCLHKSPDQRYATAQDLADDLRRFLRGEPIIARPVSAIERAVKWVKRHPAIAGLSSLLAASMLGMVVLQTVRIRESEQARTNEAQLHRQIQDQLAGKLVLSAGAVWNSGNVAEARQILQECPESARQSDWKALYDLCHAEIASLPVPDFLGTSIIVSPDGKRLAYPCKDTTYRLKIVDFQNGDVHSTFPIGVATCQLAFTPDSQTLVAIIHDRLSNAMLRRPKDQGDEVVIWNIGEKKARRRWRLGEPTSIGLSPSGRRIAARHENRIRIWDSFTGNLILELPPTVDDSLPMSFAWDKSDTRVAVRSSSTIQIWDVDPVRLVRELPAEALDCRRLEKVMPFLANFADPVFVRPDGEMIWANAEGPQQKAPTTMPTQRTLIAWNIADGNEAYRLTTRGMTTRLTLSDDGRWMAFQHESFIEVHNAQTGEKLASLRGQPSLIQRLQFSPDGTRIYSLATDKTVRIWDVRPWCH